MVTDNHSESTANNKDKKGYKSELPKHNDGTNIGAGADPNDFSDRSTDEDERMHIIAEHRAKHAETPMEKTKSKNTSPTLTPE